jgi:hypothetical protein
VIEKIGTISTINPFARRTGQAAEAKLVTAGPVENDERKVRKWQRN